MAIVPVSPSLVRYHPPWPIHYPIHEYPTLDPPTYSEWYPALRSIDRAVYYSISNPGNFWIWDPDQ